MSLRPDGSYKCDRCGASVGNAAVTECVMVADIEFLEDGSAAPRNLHFCRVPNEGAPEGCAEHLLVPSNLADYLSATGAADE